MRFHGTTAKLGVVLNFLVTNDRSVACLKSAMHGSEHMVGSGVHVLEFAWTIAALACCTRRAGWLCPWRYRCANHLWARFSMPKCWAQRASVDHKHLWHVRKPIYAHAGGLLEPLWLKGPHDDSSFCANSQRSVQNCPEGMYCRYVSLWPSPKAMGHIVLTEILL